MRLLSANPLPKTKKNILNFFDKIYFEKPGYFQIMVAKTCYKKMQKNLHLPKQQQQQKINSTNCVALGIEKKVFSVTIGGSVKYES